MVSWNLFQMRLKDTVKLREVRENLNVPTILKFVPVNFKFFLKDLGK